MFNYLHSLSRWWWRLLLGLVVASLALIAFFAYRTSSVLSPTPPTSATLEKGAIAPDFTLPTLDGTKITLASFRGHPVILNFWASWCPPCLAEIPEFMAVYESYREQGLVILAVNTTFQDSRTEAEDFIRELNVPFPVLVDEVGDVTSKAYKLRGLPMTIFIDRDGIARHIQIGVLNQAIINWYLLEILQ